MIETTRIILRPWNADDAESLYKYASNPAIGPAAGWPPHNSIEESREIIHTVFAAPEVYAVVLKSTGQPVGCCGLMTADSMHAQDMANNEAEIGYWIGEEYWGNGLIPEAVEALLHHGFHNLNLAAVWCAYYDGNSKSKRVCEKAGFRFHHTTHGITTPLGDVRTEHHYRMTRQDFDSRNSTSAHNAPAPNRHTSDKHQP